MVNLLSVLRDQWRYAYDPMNTAGGAADWHHTLMTLEQRLREWAARTGCTLGVHRADVRAAYPDDGAEWERHVQADIAARTRRQRSATSDAGNGG